MEQLAGEKTGEMKNGDWRVYSELDRRWVATGHNPSQSDAQTEGQRAVADLQKKLGDPPNDLVWVYKLK